MVTSISSGFHRVHGVQLARSLRTVYRFPTLFLRAFAMYVAEGVSHVLGLSEDLSKLIPIDEQPNHQIVHVFRLGKTRFHRISW